MGEKRLVCALVHDRGCGVRHLAAIPVFAGRQVREAPPAAKLKLARGLGRRSGAEEGAGRIRVEKRVDQVREGWKPLDLGLQNYAMLSMSSRAVGLRFPDSP